MKILLIYPQTNGKVVGGDMLFIHEPLSLEYLGAAVKDSHDVKILDMRISDKLAETLASFSPNVVGITAFTLHVNRAKDILKAVKAHDRDILTVVGGPHATALPEDFHEDFVDVVVIGEGTFPFREIVNRAEGNKDLKGISGTSVRDNGRFVSTPPRTYPGLDALPFPDRSLTAGFRDRYFTPFMKPLASIKSSIGCSHRCNYCMLWKITDGRFMPRDPVKVAEELAGIRESNVFFADDDTLLDGDRMIELAKVIRKQGIAKKYQVNGRADTIAGRPDVIEKWREIGLASVVMGFESYRDEDLQYFHRGMKVSANREALRILRENDILPVGYFIVRPDYDRKNFEDLKNYIHGLNLKYMIFTVLTPIPGTDLYEESKSRIIKNDYDLYDFRHTLLPTKLPLEEFYAELADLFETAVPRWKGILRLFEKPLKEIIPTHRRNKEITTQLKNAYKDY